MWFIIAYNWLLVYSALVFIIFLTSFLFFFFQTFKNLVYIYFVWEQNPAESGCTIDITQMKTGYGIIHANYYRQKGMSFPSTEHISTPASSSSHPKRHSSFKIIEVTMIHTRRASCLKVGLVINLLVGEKKTEIMSEQWIYTQSSLKYRILLVRGGWDESVRNWMQKRTYHKPQLIWLSTFRRCRCFYICRWSCSHISSARQAERAAEKPEKLQSKCSTAGVFMLIEMAAFWC